MPQGKGTYGSAKGRPPKKKLKKKKIMGVKPNSKPKGKKKLNKRKY